MARRTKSMMDIENQYERIRSAVRNGFPRFGMASLERARDARDRYLENIERTRSFQRENDVERGVLRQYPRRVYMGLNEG